MYHFQTTHLEVVLSYPVLLIYEISKPKAPEEALQSLEHAPPSPDYVPGLEHPPSLDYVPGLEYPEYVALSDDEVPIKDQPLPADGSPTALSPGYVADSDPSKEDPKEDPEEDPTDYPTDGGDDDEEESSGDNDDDEEEEEEDEASEEEEEEHLAPTNSTMLPAIDPVPSTEDTKTFETDESAPTLPLPISPRTKVPFSQTRLRRARKTVRPQPPMTASTEALIAEYASTPTPPSPPPSPLSPWSPPLPHIPSPPLPVLSLTLPLPTPPTHTSPLYADTLLGYRAAMIRSRAANTIPRARFTTPDSRFEVGESSTAAATRQARHTLSHRVDYGFVDIVDASIHDSESFITLTKERIIPLLERLSTYDRDVSVLQRQRIDDGDRLMSHIQHEHDRFIELVRTRDAGPQDGLADKMSPKKITAPMTDAAIKQLIAQGVADALADDEANRNSRNGDDNTDYRKWQKSDRCLLLIVHL
ncbi:hypothetical protein Tco_0282279 [Tanacetum coccineum]